jgi:hypothetical protein
MARENPTHTAANVANKAWNDMPAAERSPPRNEYAR